MVSLAEKIPSDPDPDRSTEGDVELLRAAADVAPAEAEAVFSALANSIEGLENFADPPPGSWEADELIRSYGSALAATEACGVDFILLDAEVAESLLSNVVAGGPNAIADAGGLGPAGSDVASSPEEICADFAAEVDPGTFPTAALATAADALGGLDADDPEVADLAEAMDEAAETSAALLDAAAAALGVDRGSVVFQRTESGVFAYPADEGLTAIQPVPDGADLYEAVVEAEEALRQAAEAAGLDDCAAWSSSPSD